MPLHVRSGELRGAEHSKARDRKAITYHYDVGNDFYKLWLGQRMLYSCAYFQTGEEELDTAQTAKLEHICRKLRLQPGDRLLDIGCGWGGLIAYAAQHYGVDATGITLSQPQADLANGRIAEAGLADSCRVVLLDYRDLEARREEAVTQVGERMYRVWRLYMAGCSHSFDNARLSVHQSLLSKPDGEGRSQQPMTRAHIYA